MRASSSPLWLADEWGILRAGRLRGSGGEHVDKRREDRREFMKAVAYFRKLGHKRITLKTGSYGMEALALSIRCATEFEL